MRSSAAVERHGMTRPTYRSLEVPNWSTRTFHILLTDCTAATAATFRSERPAADGHMSLRRVAVMTKTSKTPHQQAGHYGWGLAAFITAAAGASGFGVGVWMLAESFCIFECTAAQHQQAGTGLIVTAFSCPVLVAASVAGIWANRRHAGRPWAQAALCLSAIPVILGLMAVLLIVPML